MSFCQSAEAGYYSFFNWNGYGSPQKWVYFDNFLRVLNDPIFHQSLINNLLVVLVSAFIQVPAALWLALLISDKSRSSVVFRALFFVPYILGEVVAGLIWRYIYDGNYGVVAVVYHWFGKEAPQVLAERGWATAALLLVIVWKYFGFHMALFIAGRQGIPNDVLESAQIDGASRWQITRRIVLPMMRPGRRAIPVLQHSRIATDIRHYRRSNRRRSIKLNAFGSFLLVHVWDQTDEGRLWERSRGGAVYHLRSCDGFL